MLRKNDFFFTEGFPLTTLFKTKKKRRHKTSCWAHVAKTYCPVISCGLTKSLLKSTQKFPDWIRRHEFSLAKTAKRKQQGYG